MSSSVRRLALCSAPSLVPLKSLPRKDRLCRVFTGVGAAAEVGGGLMRVGEELGGPRPPFSAPGAAIGPSPGTGRSSPK